MTLDRAAILAAPDLRTTEVAVPAWGGSVRLRELDGAGRDAWEATCTAARNADGTMDLAGVKARLVTLCAVDADGTRMFTDADQAALQAKSGAALDVLWRAALQLNALTDAEVDDLGKG